ncbi:MAG: c-type cytochrome [Fuerstiella sp.]
MADAQIPQPDDAPPPLTPEESAGCFTVPPGFKVELVACEPLIQEPSGVCWDETGQLFVCELHGYNLEGQYDIEELNKTGQLDRVVRRVQAEERHKKAAEKDTYGTIRKLYDDNNDRVMDRAEVWADRLPPCLGICPANGGLIAACQTQVLFLADRDGDGKAEVRDVLFEGFTKGPLERSINCPQWGPDNWIYLGSGAGGGTIRGKYLAEPVELPRTDFRIRPDGSSIEPVVGTTHTMGFAFTEAGDRFVISTRTPGIFVAPLSWHYLARNPDVPAPELEHSATSDQRTWPTSQPHPWRTRRAEDPGFSDYYSDRYGIEESAPNGYFTSACSPLVYQDVRLPGLRGHLLACEPAQNMVHRSIVERDGTRLRLRRAAGEEQSEFLTSSDPWFHAISMSHAPDGTILIVDFYREIIEDYSAIPRYLQQQYGLVGGRNHGRIWRLTHKDSESKTPPTEANSAGKHSESTTGATMASADMSCLTPLQLSAEIASPGFWRRQTARRLLVEQTERDKATQQDISTELSRLVREAGEPATVLNALATLDGTELLTDSDVAAALRHSEASVRRRALQLSERWLNNGGGLLDQVTALTSDDQPMVRLQLALSLGESRDDRALDALARLARDHGDERWMLSAILTGLHQQSGLMLSRLLQTPDDIGQAEPLPGLLSAAIARRRDGPELSRTLQTVVQMKNRRLLITCLAGIRSGLSQAMDIELSEETREAVKRLAVSTDDAIRNQALPLISLLNMETAEERRARLAQAVQDLNDVTRPTPERVAAVFQLADDPDPGTTQTLLAAVGSATPRVRDAILDAVLAHRHRATQLLDAIEAGTVPASVLTSVQRATLLESNQAKVREKAARLLTAVSHAGDEKFNEYSAALQHRRDVVHGQQVFRTKCGGCHQAHGIGHAVGPDLSAEFLRAEETIIRDILVPGEKISSGYVTYTVATTSGKTFNGLLASESPTSITLRQAEGKEQVILRRDVEELRAMSVSMMPDNLTSTVSPSDLADALAWLRRPPTELVLLDEDDDVVNALQEGSGTVEFITGDSHSGQRCLQVTPFQRHSPRIPGWKFRIRERPGAGEYRYLRMAWKAPEAHGVLLELADSGNWPPAEKPLRRYHAGRNSTSWQSVEVDTTVPRDWVVVTRDLWQDFGDFTLTGMAPTALGGPVQFDRLELLQVDPRGQESVE